MNRGIGAFPSTQNFLMKLIVLIPKYFYGSNCVFTLPSSLTIVITFPQIGSWFSPPSSIFKLYEPSALLLSPHILSGSVDRLLKCLWPL
jgi:hypothetical protein